MIATKKNQGKKKWRRHIKCMHTHIYMNTTIWVFSTAICKATMGQLLFKSLMDTPALVLNAPRLARHPHQRAPAHSATKVVKSYTSAKGCWKRMHRAAYKCPFTKTLAAYLSLNHFKSFLETGGHTVTVQLDQQLQPHFPHSDRMTEPLGCCRRHLFSLLLKAQLQ